MNVVAVNIRAPGDDVLGMAERLRLAAQLASHHRDKPLAAGGGADRPVELRRAQAMKEAMVHAGVVQHAQRAAIGVRQDRLRAKLAAYGAQALIDFIQRRVPTDPLKIFLILGARALGNILLAAHGIQQAPRRIHPVQIFRHFGAKKSPRHRMARVTLDLGGSAIFHGDLHPASIGTIMRARGIDLLLHG